MADHGISREEISYWAGVREQFLLQPDIAYLNGGIFGPCARVVVDRIAELNALLNTDVGELVIARLSPAGYDEISRTHLIDPTSPVTRRRPQGQGPVVHWSHPAYANRHVITRNDEEIVRFSLAGTR